MGFAQEMKDALSAFTTISENVRKDRAEERQGKYYDALIQNQKASQDLSERKFAEEKRQFGMTQAIALRDQGSREKQQAFDRQLKTDQQALAVKKGTAYVDYMKAQAEKLRNGGLPDFTGAANQGAANIGAGPGAPATGVLPTVPAPQPMQSVPMSQGDAEEEDANGGLVGRNMRFADGGAVPAPTPEEFKAQADRLAARSALPTEPLQRPVPAQQPAPQQQAALTPPQEAIPVTSQSNPAAEAAPKGDGTKDKTSGGFDAVKALESWGVTRDVAGVKGVPENPVTLGLDYIVHTDRPTAGVPANGAPTSSAAQTVATNEGAADPETVRKLHEVVDPHNELTPAAKTIATLDATTKYYLGQGDIKKAQASAASLLMYAKQESQKLGALAAVAIQHGNIEAATKYLARAYDAVPDGQTLKAKVVDGVSHMTAVDADGKENDLGAVDAQQLMKLSLGVANGSEYMSRVSQIASYGARPARQTGAGAGGAKALKPHEKSEEEGNLSGAVDAQLKGVGADEKRWLVGTAKRVATRNPQLTTDEAVDYTASMLKVNEKDPDSVPFKASPVKDESGKVSGYQVRFGKRVPITLSADEFDDVIDQRSQKVAALKAKQTKDKEDAKKPSLIRDLLSATRDKAGNVVSTPGAAGEVDVFGGEQKAIP